MVLTSTGIWTYERMVKELPAESRYELIENDLFEMPAPTTNHQILQERISFELSFLNRQKQLGYVFPPVFDVIFDKGIVVQPDLTFILNENKHKIKQRGCLGSPDIIFEIVSASTVQRDYYTKRTIYEKFGVQEYWIIDPAYQAIEVLVLKEKKFEEMSEIIEDGEAKSILLPDFKIDAKNFFSNLL